MALRLQVGAFLASIAGIAVSIYLTAVHFAGVPLACPAGAVVNCEVVLGSAYALIPGTQLPTAAAGIVWFAVSAAIWLRPFTLIHAVWSSIGLLTVLYLVFIEIVRLGAICIWCTATHVLVVAIFLFTVAELTSPREDLAPDR
jgi:uncharacterized membrane protein